MTVVFDTESAPTILLVEDRTNRLNKKKRALEALGCGVITATDSDQALALLRSSPAVDLILTDIHLAGPDDAKDGVSLARLVRDTYDPDLPIYGYSAHFSEGEMSPDDLSLFNEAATKGAMSAEDQGALNRRCVAAASDRRRVRLAQRTSTGERLIPAVRSSEFLIKFDDSDTIEKALANSGFELRLLDTTVFNELRAPVPAWLQHLPSGVSMQVYGQPLLHSFADTEANSAKYLVEFMIGVHADIAAMVAGREQVPAAYLRLAEYLMAVLRD